MVASYTGPRRNDSYRMASYTLRRQELLRGHKRLGHGSKGEGLFKSTLPLQGRLRKLRGVHTKLVDPSNTRYEPRSTRDHALKRASSVSSTFGSQHLQITICHGSILMPSDPAIMAAGTITHTSFSVIPHAAAAGKGIPGCTRSP
ncbi:hypothetical protein PGTUg99_027392 [Puccinia graminis f. sp. tritici]|uniref:Uncharacterized protein n=1 Tax=Puccinia graminis f. sp. tritici TaxID=56615 RepID=A0A5B0N0Z9_PUCGR|nr:hypothetical protein PGTUg99_027392 [Puccinia graminis f. sp. tritici]